jgi:hypothetical protein
VNKRPQEARDIIKIHREITSKVKKGSSSSKGSNNSRRNSASSSTRKDLQVKAAVFAPIIAQEDHQDSQIYPPSANLHPHQPISTPPSTMNHQDKKFFAFARKYCVVGVALTPKAMC